MYWDDPHGAEVEVWDEADKNTYTVTLEITKNITIDLGMFADDDNFVHFRVSESLDKPVIIDVQVGVGNDIRRTSIIIPTGKTSGRCLPLMASHSRGLLGCRRYPPCSPTISTNTQLTH